MKTRATDASVDAFLRSIPDDARRQDCLRVLEIMKGVTGDEPMLWGPGMVGFGSYHYRYESGREGDWFVTGRRRRSTTAVLDTLAMLGVLQWSLVLAAWGLLPLRLWA